MSTKRSQDNGFFTGFLSLQSFLNCNCNCVGWLWSWHDTFGASELYCCTEALSLSNRLGIHQTKFVDVRNQRSHTVVAQATCVNWIWNEIFSKSVHLHKWCHTCSVTKVVSVSATSK